MQYDLYEADERRKTVPGYKRFQEHRYPDGRWVQHWVHFSKCDCCNYHSHLDNTDHGYAIEGVWAPIELNPVEDIVIVKEVWFCSIECARNRALYIHYRHLVMNTPENPKYEHAGHNNPLIPVVITSVLNKFK